MTPHSRELADLLESRIGQEFDGECHLTEDEARQIAALLRREPSVEEVARVIRENVSPAMAEAAVEAVAALWGREPG